MTKTQIGPVITTEAKAMLVSMSQEDLRTIGAFIELLIRKEHKRRKAASVLVDSGAEYGVPQ